jgi:2-oxoglutarate ferredoxin oxidoreductase subunit delta
MNYESLRIYAVRKMAGKIIIDIERCKGCGLCVAVCAKAGIAISKKSNKSGYFPAEPVPSVACGEQSLTVEGASNTDCTGCAVCAIVCPDAAIEVFRENKIVPVKSNKKGKPNLIKEKA